MQNVLLSNSQFTNERVKTKNARVGVFAEFRNLDLSRISDSCRFSFSRSRVLQRRVHLDQMLDLLRLQA